MCLLRRRSKELAKKSFSPASYELARSYESGSGTEKDPEKALIHYRKAAIDGVYLAQASMIIEYFPDNGIVSGGRLIDKPDHFKSYVWIKIAEKTTKMIAKNHPDVPRNSSVKVSFESIHRKIENVLLEKLTKTQINQAKEIAKEWHPGKEPSFDYDKY